MDTLFIVLGIIVMIIATVVRFVMPAVLKKSTISSKTYAVVMIISVLTMISGGLFFYAEPGHSYLVQYPWGTQVAELDPGYHFYWYGNVLDFKKVLTVRLTDMKDENSETATAQNNSVTVRFNDSVRADISCSTRFRLPEDPALFKKMALDYRTQNNLVHSSLVPVTREVIRNAARELSAQSYVTGQGGQFETNIFDQMENGIVVLKVIEYQGIGTSDEMPDTVPDIPAPVKDEGAAGVASEAVEKIKKVDEDRGVRTDQKVFQKVVRLTNPDGSLKRKPHPIAAYGIKVTQSTVENVQFEEMFQKMLAKQRDAAAKAAVSRQEAKQAEYEKQKIMAEGETTKARIKMEQEQQQVQRIIAAETAKKEEEILLKKAEIEKQRIEVESQAMLAKADAEAKARKLKMVADGALEQKLAAWIEVNKAYAQSFSQQKVVPNVVVGGGDGKTPSAADFMSLMTAMSAHQLGVDTRISE